MLNFDLIFYLIYFGFLFLQNRASWFLHHLNNILNAAVFFHHFLMMTVTLLGCSWFHLLAHHHVDSNIFFLANWKIKNSWICFQEIDVSFVFICIPIVGRQTFFCLPEDSIFIYLCNVSNSALLSYLFSLLFKIPLLVNLFNYFSHNCWLGILEDMCIWPLFNVWINLLRNWLRGDSGDARDCMRLRAKLPILWLIVVWEELVLGIKCQIMHVIFRIPTELAITILIGVDILIRK